jgi:hypothetical protein
MGRASIISKFIIDRVVVFKAIPAAWLFHSREAFRPFAWCIVGLCAGLYLFFNGFRLLRRRHLILDTPISKIRSASMGMVELNGLAIGPYTLQAPITNRECYFFRSVVWEYKREGRSSRWVKVAAECQHVPFFLDDNTAKVLIDPRGAELDLHCDFEQQFSDALFTMKEEVPPNVRTLLSRHGINTTNKIKVEEFCIKPKNALFVLGTLGDNPGIEVNSRPITDDEHNTLTSSDALWFNPMRALESSKLSSGNSSDEYDAPLEESLVGNSLEAGNASRESATSTTSTRVIKLSPDSGPPKLNEMTQQQKIAAALMKAGIANPAAWAAAGVTTATLSGTKNGSANGTTSIASDSFEQKPPVVLRRGKNDSTFLISWRSQRAVASSLGWKCALMIWGGPALALLCLYGIITFARLL